MCLFSVNRPTLFLFGLRWTDDGSMITIAHLSIQLLCTNNTSACNLILTSFVINYVYQYLHAVDIYHKSYTKSVCFVLVTSVLTCRWYLSQELHQVCMFCSCDISTNMPLIFITRVTPSLYVLFLWHQYLHAVDIYHKSYTKPVCFVLVTNCFSELRQNQTSQVA